MKKILIIFMAIALTGCGLESECLTNDGAFSLPDVALYCVVIPAIVVIILNYFYSLVLKKQKRKEVANPYGAQRLRGIAHDTDMSVYMDHKDAHCILKKINKASSNGLFRIRVYCSGDELDSIISVAKRMGFDAERLPTYTELCKAGVIIRWD